MRTGEERRAPPGTGSKMVGAGLLALVGVVFIVLGVAIGDSVSLPIAVAVGALSLGLAFFLFRQSFPKRLRGVTVSVSSSDVWRGDEVEVRVEVTGAAGAEVGLVCTEYYEGFNPGGEIQRVQATLNDVAYEEWRPLRDAGGVQTERFKVPLGAPFSFRGEVLTYEWAARVRKGRASADAQVVVLP